ncbi:MAG: CinA family protein [Phyllobacteriaceae bacterium]|nr:CinA family protein [Phyllobacteriaceae bacterium]
MSVLLATAVLEAAKEKGVTIALAESCTGGLVAAELTAIPGSSTVVERGFVTYSNTAKQEMLGVAAASLDAHGAVSAEVAREMAEGALAHSRANLAIAVTGIAGPDGGTADKPVGLVWFAIAMTGHATHAKHRTFKGFSRVIVRKAATETALRLLLASLGKGHLDDSAM